MKHFKHLLELTLFCAGLVLFGVVIKSVDPSRLTVIFHALSGGGWLVFTFYLFIFSWDVWGWKMVFGRPWNSKLDFRNLFMIRLAGEAVNSITPIMDVGGEPLKIILVSKRYEIPKTACLSSVIVGRAAVLVAQVFFMTTGLVLSAFLLPLPPEWRWGLAATLFIFTLFTAFFIFAQKKGLFSLFMNWLDYFELDPGLLERFQIPFQKMDDETAHFYSREKKRFRYAVYFHTVAWFCTAVEIYFMFRLIGVPISFIKALMIEPLLQLVRTATFFIPASLGTQEAGLAFFTYLLGYHPALGVAVSLLKRLRQLLWTGIGFAIWGATQLIRLGKAWRIRRIKKRKKGGVYT